MLLLASSCTDDTESGEKEDKIYTINITKFGIRADKTEAIATTNGINEAIEWAKTEGYNTVRLPEGDYLIHCIGETDWYATNGIFVPTNMTLDLGNARLHVAPNDSKHYALIQIDHVENTTIRGGHLIGDRKDKDKSHFQGYGIQVIASTNVTIEDVTIEGVTGDGIIFTTYIYMSFNGKFPSKKVKVTGCDISDCGRQGIHAIQVKGLEISNNTFHDILGSGSQYGIDINPNPAWQSIAEQITIRNNTFKDCSDGMRLWGGSDMEIYENDMQKMGIYGIKSQRVHIYKNTLTDTGAMYIGAECEDYCIPTEGEDKNTCYKITDLSAKTENFTCP